MSTTLKTPSYSVGYWLVPIETNYVEDGMMTHVYDEPQKIVEFRIYLRQHSLKLNIEYMAHVAQIGDVPWVKNESMVGGPEVFNHVEGYAVRLTGEDAPHFKVRYRAKLRDKGLTKWFTDGQFCGTRGEGRPVEAMQVQLFLKTEELKNAFQAAQQFVEWVDNGGESKIGFQAGATENLYREIDLFRQQINVDVSWALKKVTREWQEVQVQREVDQIYNSIQTILDELQEANRQVDTLQKTAARMKVENNDLIGQVESHIEDDERIIKRAEEELPQINRKLEAAKRARKEAQDELTGTKGFGNGFLTSITLGIHNPVKENLEKAKQAMKDMKQALDREEELIKNKTKSLAELREGDALLQNMKDIDAAVASLQNTIINLEREIEDTQKNEKRVMNTNSGLLRSRFQERVGKEMEELERWSIQLQQLADA
jgi:tetratricopeptide (TPR) repeat protein